VSPCDLRGSGFPAVPGSLAKCAKIFKRHTDTYFTLRNFCGEAGKERLSSCQVNTLHLARRPANRMQRATSQRRLPLETIWPSVLANELPPKIWLAHRRGRRRCKDNHLGEGLVEGQSVDPYQSLNGAPQNYAQDNSGMKSWTTLLCALRLSALTACA